MFPFDGLPGFIPTGWNPGKGSISAGRKFSLRAGSKTDCRGISKVLSENNTEEAAIDNVQNDTLVGILRNKNQLHVCLQHNYYYCPKSRMPGNPDELRYVALNMTPRIFGKESGMHYIGRINKISLVKRSDITEIPKNTDEIYYRFAVSRWVQLTSNIEHCNFSILYLSSSKDIKYIYN